MPKFGDAKGNVTSKYESELFTPLKLQLLKIMPPKAIADDGNNRFNMSFKVSSTKSVPKKQESKRIFEKELKKQNINRNDWYKVSEYGGSTIGELWAETATAIHTNTKIPNEFVRAFNETIKTIPGL